MRPLTAQEMLSAWETGMGRSPADRALLLLAAGCPETSKDDLASLPIGRRDERLLALRECTLGSTLSSLASCPACGSSLELNFSVSDVRVSAPAMAEEALSVEAHGWEVTFRLPCSADLSSLEGVEDKQAHLLRRCVQRARRAGKERALSRVPARVLDAVIQQMGEADPQADVHASLECPGCAHQWLAAFDIVSFFWDELESWVHRTLQDVHALAAAYGWCESEVLALSPWRRQRYIQLAHS